jgi:hypothetical protein
MGKSKPKSGVRYTPADRLYDKRLNPFAAAAGGYVLARTFDRTFSPDWLAWTGNLMNWFPWLPDGAILHGWLQWKQLGNAEIAQACFHKAVERGVPVFTEGLRMLSQGLAHLPADIRNSELTHGMLARARAYAIASDPRQVFTTFYGDSPDHPELPPTPLIRRTWGSAKKRENRS